MTRKRRKTRSRQEEGAMEHGRLSFPECPKCGKRAIWTHLMGWTQPRGHNHDPNRKECPNGHHFNAKCPIAGCNES